MQVGGVGVGVFSRTHIKRQVSHVGWGGWGGGGGCKEDVMESYTSIITGN